MKPPKDLRSEVGTSLLGEQRYLIGRGAQAELFRLADSDKHKVCVALEIYGTR